MFETVDWSERGDYVAKHGLTPADAGQALNDPNRVVLDPDPASDSGLSVRIIGYAHNRRELLTVIVLDDDGHEYGVNAWPSSPRDQRRYREMD